jgi:hypothetical protein
VFYFYMLETIYRAMRINGKEQVKPDRSSAR